jgi:hypothetical protein
LVGLLVVEVNAEYEPAKIIAPLARSPATIAPTVSRDPAGEDHCPTGEEPSHDRADREPRSGQRETHS